MHPSCSPRFMVFAPPSLTRFVRRPLTDLRRTTKVSAGQGLRRDSRFIEKPSQKSFWPSLCFGSSFQVLDLHQYAPQGHFFQGARGLKRGSALTLNQNPIFEIGSRQLEFDGVFQKIRHIKILYLSIIVLTDDFFISNSWAHIWRCSTGRFLSTMKN